MASLLAKAKEVRERLYPVLKESAFLERGVLTPEEFVAAGDELVYKSPTWTWEGGDPARRKAYLPEGKQFLATKNVPCRERAKAVEKCSGFVETAEGGDDDWLAPAVAGGTAGGNGEPEAEAAVVADITLTTPEEREDQPSYDDDEEDLGDDDAAAASSSKILRTRTYDLTISYDKYWQTPRMWLFGYDEDTRPLTQSQVFEDIVLDYARRTVTFETHPHLPHPHASIHPCKHPAAMKRIIDNMAKPGATKNQGPRPDQALFIFLKFLQSVVPTIDYDYTLDAVVS
mmetsp:Transcript_7161/g.23515  ORF Transcript_7161/g.23515 Transcript_7161/m.23515 type:complete len:286 (-) Transcript_7161:173-1030(-)